MAEVIAVEDTVDLRASEVWDAIVNPASRARWWPTVAFEPAMGAPITEAADDGISLSGTVRNVVPNLRLEFTWADPAWASHTTVVMSLIDDGGRTVVRIREHGFDSATAHHAEQRTSAWQRRLASLTSLLESARD